MANVGIENDIAKKTKAKRGRPAKKKVEAAQTSAPMCCDAQMTPVGGSLYECKVCGEVKMVPLADMTKKEPLSTDPLPLIPNPIGVDSTAPIIGKDEGASVDQEELSKEAWEKDIQGVMDICDKDLEPRALGMRGGPLSYEEVEKLLKVIKGKNNVWVDKKDMTVISSDGVTHPAHYIKGRKYEPIDVAEDWELDKDAYLFNVFKYIARAGRKGDALEDLEKARFYLDRRIAKMKGKRCF